MRRRSTAHQSVPDGGAFGAAGWLFAELALVLMVIAFGASELPGHPDGDLGQGQTVGSSTPTPVARGLNLDTDKFMIPAEAMGDPASIRAAFQAGLDAKGVGPDVRVGLVLLFGVSSACVQGAGTAESEAVRDALEQQLPEPLSSAEIRTYIGRGECGSVNVELFVVTGDR